MRRTIVALSILAAGLVGGSPAFADGQTDGGAAELGRPTGLAAPEPGRQESTTCGGTIGCTILRGACGLASGTYSEWHSRDHGHPHGICTWPWE